MNTISSVCRENPDRARELLLTLSLYYRQTLENEQYMIRLSTELYQVMNYLKLEQARFEEKLAVEFDIEESWIASCPLLSCSLLWKMRCAMAWIKGASAL